MENNVGCDNKVRHLKWLLAVMLGVGIRGRHCISKTDNHDNDDDDDDVDDDIGGNVIDKG